MRSLIRIHPDDDVAVAVTPLEAGSEVEIGGVRLRALQSVPAGHKIALRDLDAGAPVIKYGFPIGRAQHPIQAGDWVHEHNLSTALSGRVAHRFSGSGRASSPAAEDGPAFDGYRRADGRVGTRNEIWVLNTVGCVNRAAERIARQAADRLADRPAIDGVHAFPHPYGCSQLGDDLDQTRKILAGLLRHPNAGGVLVLGLGCENNQLDALLELAGEGGVERARLRSFNSQQVVDEVEAGVDAALELAAVMDADRRSRVPAAELVVGLKCGGSDGFSGLTANPLLGRFADRLTGLGGSALLSEVPEMFGAEQVLLERAIDHRVFDQLAAMIDDFKTYFEGHGLPIYENPSPGNRAGGLTTLEEKSLGAIQKGGRAPIVEVLPYGTVAPRRAGGLAILEAPGNDGVSSTAMIASGATILLFTTGRGTPMGFPAPTLKVSSNSELAEKKPHWIDFDAGRLLASDGLDLVAEELFTQVLEVASGRIRTRNEERDEREIAIWKRGVTL